jgi:hypothetical protein
MRCLSVFNAKDAARHTSRTNLFGGIEMTIL